jgi:hypothetical protein
VSKLKAASLAPKQSKVETLTIRMSPKIKYGLEILSRKQHRTLTSVAEWALDRVLNDRNEGLWMTEGNETFNLLERIWDPIEPDRFIKLALQFPTLLTYEEELLWKVVCENGFFWKGSKNKQGILTWECSSDSIKINAVREHWDSLKKVISGDLEPESLPSLADWEEEGPPIDGFYDEDAR